MERVGRIFRKNIGQLQTILEDKIGAALGEVEIAPMNRYADEALAEFNNEFTNPDKWQQHFVYYGMRVAMFFLEDLYVARARGSTIFYSRSPLWFDLNEEQLMHVELHELAHLGHERLLNKKKQNFTPWEDRISEGFAEYIATEIMKDLRLKPWPNKNLKRFQKELDANQISTFKGAIDYALKQA